MQHLRPAQAKAVARAALDEIFKRTLVEIGAVHSPAEVLKTGERPVFRPLLHDLLDKASPDVFDGGKPEADTVRTDGEMVAGGVEIRRQDGNAHHLALGNILGDLHGAVEHRGHQRRHILPRIIALEPRRLIRNDSVADGMRLIEGVVCKVVHLVVDALRHIDRDAVRLAAADTARGVSVDERAAFFFDVLDFFLRHRTAHHVRLPERVAAELAEDLDDLLLIEDAAVGDGEDGL